MSNHKKTLRIETKKGLEFKDVRTGANGTFDVVQECISLIQDINYFDAQFPLFIVNEIFRPNNLNSYSSLETKLRAIYDYVVKNIVYVSDVKGIESIKDARTTVSTGFGDCDDHSILLCNCVAAIGLTPLLVIAKIYNDKAVSNVKNSRTYTTVKPRDYNHIYTAVKNGDTIYTLDTALIKPEFNVEASFIIEKKFVNVFGGKNGKDVNGYAGIKNVYRRVADNIKSVAETALPFSAFAPVPFAGKFGAAVMTATGLDNNDYSLSSLTADIHKKPDSLIRQVEAGYLSREFALKQAAELRGELIISIAQTKDINSSVYLKSVEAKIIILEKAISVTMQVAV